MQIQRALSLTIALLTFGCSSGRAQVAAPTGKVDGVDFRKEYIRIMNQSPSPEKDKAVEQLMQFYAHQVFELPRNLHRASGLVTDEQGNALDDVEVNAALGQVNFNMLDGPQVVAEKTIKINKTFDVDFHGYFSVELHFAKEGYQSAVWRSWLGYDGVEHAQGNYESFTFEPRTDNKASIQIVLRRTYKWEPPAPERFLRPVPMKEWPKAAPRESSVIVSINKPNVVAVTMAGTYVLVDQELNVLDAWFLFPGDLVGFKEIEGKVVSWPKGNIPYSMRDRTPSEWRLYSLAEPIIPTTRPTTQQKEMP